MSMSTTIVDTADETDGGLSIMRIILRSDRKGLGKRGDIVEVSDGHARNFLLPKGHALKASDGAVTQAASMRRVARSARRPGS